MALEEKKYRSFLKGITWRIIGTIDTVLVSYFHSKDPFTSGLIGLTEVPTKIVLYYVHERMYFFTFGEKTYSRKVSLIKGITWRFLGSLDTMLIALIFTGNLKMGLKIASTEFVTKVILYYIHERVWTRIKLGKIDADE
jgi:uncharacterized membrane protein